MVIIDSMLIHMIGKLLKDGGRKIPQKCSYYLISHYKLFTFLCIPDLEQERTPKRNGRFFFQIGKIWKLLAVFETSTSFKWASDHIRFISKEETQVS